MLCAFNSLNDIKSCHSKDIQNRDGANTVVFRAEKVLAGGVVQSFYACLLSSRDEHGSPSLSDLQINFPTVSNSSIYSVWKSKKTWGECFEELNAIQNATASKSVLLEDCSFLLDSDSWPKLSSESAFSQGLRSENWMIAEVQTLGDILEKLALDSAAALESWELLNHSSAAGESPNASSPVDPSTRTGPVTRGTVRSYREALLKATASEGGASAEQLAAENARKRLAADGGGWQPRIVVQAVKHEHKDKLYRHNLIEKGINPDALYEPEEEDGGGYDGGSFFQSSEYAKGSVSVNRMRAATLMRPAALEKKMARIASKEAHRPPVPLSSAAAYAAASSRKNAMYSAAAAAQEHDGQYYED